MLEMKETTETDLARMAARGAVYICDPCYITTKKITVVSFTEATNKKQHSKGIFHSICPACEALLSNCKACKRNKKK